MRREKIVARLAGDLGLPDEDVRTALEQISPDAALSPPTSIGAAMRRYTGAMTIPEFSAGPLTGTRRTRRWLWVGLLALTFDRGCRGRDHRRPRIISTRADLSADGDPRHRDDGGSDTLPSPPPIPPPETRSLPPWPPSPAAWSGTPRARSPLRQAQRPQAQLDGYRSAGGRGPGHDEVWLYNSVIEPTPAVLPA